ncbi:MAG: hypothetical protein H6R24_340 [Proteobacteria bacterium]|nr:hypothetical protein [Pseudomonadota bacterium]
MCARKFDLVVNLCQRQFAINRVQPQTVLQTVAIRQHPALIRLPPVGFDMRAMLGDQHVLHQRFHLGLHPDEEVQARLGLIFAKFDALGSAALWIKRWPPGGRPTRDPS